MPDYTVKLQGAGAGAPVTFSVPPGLHVRCSRRHRQDVTPEVLAVEEFTIRLPLCRVYSSDGTPDKAQEAFGTFLTACLQQRTKPTYLQILDSADQAIDGIGDITVGSGGWQELLVTRYELLPGDAQFRAGVEFELELTARRLYADTNGLVYAEREWRSEVDAAGLETRTLLCRLEVAPGTPSSWVAASWVSALATLTQPSGWVKTAGGSTFEYSYPLGLGRTEVVTTRSQVARRGIALPSGAGGGTIATTRRARPELGLVEVTRSAESTGTHDIASWLLSQVPSGGTVQGERTHDEGGRSGRGAWVAFEAPSSFVGGKVSRCVVARRLVAGGVTASAARRSGHLLPAIRKGEVAEWVLEERVACFALGVTTWKDLPMLKPLGAPWVDASAGAGDAGTPNVHEFGDTPAQTVWVRTAERRYLWDGEGQPLDDPKVQAMLLRRHVNGEAGVVLS